MQHRHPRLRLNRRHAADLVLLWKAGFDGAMDTCLAIRTMVGRGNIFSVQAGAGIVADSRPDAEYEENLTLELETAAAVCAAPMLMYWLPTCTTFPLFSAA